MALQLPARGFGRALSRAREEKGVPAIGADSEHRRYGRKPPKRHIRFFRAIQWSRSLREKSGLRREMAERETE